MEKKKVLFLVTVKVKAPEGCKPRVLTEKGIIISENPKAKEKAEKEALDLVKGFYDKKYPKYNFKYHVLVEPYNYGFIKDTTDNEKIITDGTD
jgi:hypothetical protein